MKLTGILLEILPGIGIEIEKLSRAWTLSFCWCLPKALSGSTDKQNVLVESRKITLMGFYALGKLTMITKTYNFTELEAVQSRTALNPFFFKGSFSMPVYMRTCQVPILAG